VTSGKKKKQKKNEQGGKGKEEELETQKVLPSSNAGKGSLLGRSSEKREFGEKGKYVGAKKKVAAQRLRKRGVGKEKWGQVFRERRPNGVGIRHAPAGPLRPPVSKKGGEFS